jgi:hypothetical protein
MSNLLDTLLLLTFRLTLSRRVSELLGKRQQDRRWNAARKAHLAAGGVVATYRSLGESQEILL